jgi:hypothetical protein
MDSNFKDLNKDVKKRFLSLILFYFVWFVYSFVTFGIL